MCLCGDLNLEAGLCEHRLGACEGLGVVVVVPGVGPQKDHLRWGGFLDQIRGRLLGAETVRGLRGCGAGPLIAFRGEPGQLALSGDTGNALDERTGDGAGEKSIGECGRERAAARQAVGEAEDVVLQRMQAPFVALGEELRFVGGHVHLDRALGFAGLATEAKVQGFVRRRGS